MVHGSSHKRLWNLILFTSLGDDTILQWDVLLLTKHPTTNECCHQRLETYEATNCHESPKTYIMIHCSSTIIASGFLNEAS
jgi:hypothetical protein